MRSRQRPRQKKPIPGRRLIPQLFPASELLPGEVNFVEPHETPPRALEAMANLERLPEMLFQATKLELPEGKIVVGQIAQVGGILARRLDRFAGCEGTIH